MDNNFSSKTMEIISLSREEAINIGNDYIGVEHCMLAMIRDNDSLPIKILKNNKVNLSEVKSELKGILELNSQTNLNIGMGLPLSKQAEKAMRFSYLEAKNFKKNVVEPEHLLLGILKIRDNAVSLALGRFDIFYDFFKEELEIYTKNEKNEPENPNEYLTNYLKDEDSSLGISKVRSSQSSSSKTKTPQLDNYGRDITKLAASNKLDTIIGREREIERVCQILGRRKKNNPIIIGEPGVGKTAIVEGLALRIVQKKVSPVLFDKRVISLDITGLVAGTKYRGQFEERIKGIMDELEKNKDIILFIDEIHTLIGAGSASGSLDASNIFKPALSQGEIQCIGASTLDEYRVYIEKDGAFDRRFQKVLIEPPTIEETIHILNSIKSKYEEYHKVKYTPQSIEACVKLSERYINDRLLPDKAIDILDEAGSRAHLNQVSPPKSIIEIEEKINEIEVQKKKFVVTEKYETAAELFDKQKKLTIELEKEKEEFKKKNDSKFAIIDEGHIADVVSLITKIPMNRLLQNETNKLINLGERIRANVIGQDEAIAKIVKAIQRNRVGLKNPNKPIGVFIFLGSSGVGKTELAKTLSKCLFESEDNLIKIDMSEYMEKFTVSRLIGSPPGYVGYEEGGQLTELVRRKPYRVILLDEIEKAHHDFFNILLQVFDDGILTDGVGRKIDFKNTLIIMTSNVGVKNLKDFGTGIGFNTSSKLQNSEIEGKLVLERALKKNFSPEFLNRIDDVIVFNNLNKDNILKIIDLMIKELKDRIVKLGYKLEITNEAKAFIADKGYDLQLGARPLSRAIQKYIEEPIAEEMLKYSANLNSIHDILINKSNTEDKLIFTFTPMENIIVENNS